MGSGEVIAFTAIETVLHKYGDKEYAIEFYRLADGRGWVHDFNPDTPEKRTILILV